MFTFPTERRGRYGWLAGSLLVVAFSLVALCYHTSRSAENGPQQADEDPQSLASGIGQNVTGVADDDPLLGPPGPNIPLGGTNEPHIVIDPTNPLNIAYASLVSVRVSTNGGLSFQPAVGAALPATHAINGDASLAFDSQGRLFWTYLGGLFDNMGNLIGRDVFIAQLDPATGNPLPGYPVNITASPGVNLPGTAGNGADKQWLAADIYPGSPYTDRLYVVWSDLTNSPNETILTTFSTDQGQTWSAPVTLSGGGEGFIWPSHNTVAPNGDVYVTYHDQTNFVNGAPDGNSGRVFCLRSTDGGVSYPQKNTPFPPGTADLSFNRQSRPGTIPNTQFWIQGSLQAPVLADPNVPGRIYVISSDDTDNSHGSGDDADVYLAVSTNSGVNWNAPVRIDDGPAQSFSIMPAASIDFNTGCLVVTYYDNRNGATNTNGRFLLDIFAISSVDGGNTWSGGIQLNDNAFDPDPGAPCRYGPGANCITADPVTTTRIGEYNGIAVMDGLGFAVWCGNTVDGGGNPVGQQSIFDRFAFDMQAPTIACPADIVVECSQTGGTPRNDPQLAGFFAGASASDVCDSNVDITDDAPLLFPPGATTVTFTATDDAGNTASCAAEVTVIDTQKPDIFCPDDITVECSTHNGTPKNDPQLIPFFTGVSASDICDPNVAITDDAPPLFPLGTTTVTFTAEDDSGNKNTCQADVTVEDTTPPEIMVELNRNVLWPPNHKLVEIWATVTVTDICDPAPTFVLTSITSDEPDNDRGDGNTTGDIQDADFGTPDEHFKLRSERRGGGDGRKYTIVYTATDASNNSTDAAVCVTVPHDQSGMALASSGFLPDGMGFESSFDQFALIIPSIPAMSGTDVDGNPIVIQESFDATGLDPQHVYVGNTKGAVRPVETLELDVNDDGLQDLAVRYSIDDVIGFESTASSQALDEGHVGRGYTAEALGLHYRSAGGTDYLVEDILALGPPVPLLPSVPPMASDRRGPGQLEVTGLRSVRPNPFNPTTTVVFNLENPERVLLRIYDSRGALVRTLSNESLPPGEHHVRWNGRDDYDRPVATGVYFVQLLAGTNRSTRKMVLLK